MKIPCENCMCLPVCVNKVVITPSVGTKWSFYFYSSSLTDECSILWKFIHHGPGFEPTKLFYLKLKGLIKKGEGYYGYVNKSM